MLGEDMRLLGQKHVMKQLRGLLHQLPSSVKFRLTPHTQGWHHSSGTLCLRTPSYLSWAASKPDLFLGRESSLLHDTVQTSFFSKGRSYLFFPKLFPIQTSLKSIVPLLARGTEMWGTMQNRPSAEGRVHECAHHCPSASHQPPCSKPQNGSHGAASAKQSWYHFQKHRIGIQTSSDSMEKAPSLLLSVSWIFILEFLLARSCLENEIKAPCEPDIVKMEQSCLWEMLKDRGGK